MKTKDLIKNWGIAITGNIATGKSFVCNLLKKRNFHVIDADVLTKKVSEKGTPSYTKIVDFFGLSVCHNDGNLNKRALSNIIFQDKEKRQTLERIIHPAIEKSLEEELLAIGLFNSPSFWFYEAALIVEKNKSEFFKEVWLTYCSQQTQLSRIKKRNNAYSDEQIKHIISSQISSDHKKKYCHFEINTDLSKECIERKVERKIQELTRKIN